MFGDLFALEDEEETPVTLGNDRNVIIHSSQKSQKVVHTPPSVRGPTKLCGLINQGGTCYLNSLIQTLFFTPEFREQLFRLGQDELGKLSADNSFKNKVRVIPLQFQHLFTEMLLVNKASASTSELTDSFGWTHNEGFQQHDVQELNRILFSAIESSLVGTSGENLIRDLYHGTLVSKITCQECGKVSEREEDFLDLQMILTGCTSLEQSLKMSYVMLELLDGDNKYHCTGCSKLVDATRGSKLRSLPSTLTFSLVRFAYDLQRFERYKETQNYSFPLELDMREFCEEARDEDIFELYSVVIHRGSCYGGHYHAYIRDVQGLGDWMSPEEQQIAQLNANKNNAESNGVDDIDHSDPVQLISFLVTQLGGKASIAKLCQSMVKETGISWNKTFKKRYGPLMKFIKNHTDVFDIAEGVEVTLKNKDNPGNSVEVQAVKLCATNQNGHQNGTQNAPEERFPCEERTDNDGVCQNGSSGHWFDLNDSKISCINEQDIKKQFAGKESAYMLFYRRKGLHTNMINRDLLESCLTENLVADVIFKNMELEKQRKEYDLELNCISVILHFCCDYTVKDGVIVSKEGISTDPTVLTLDRRKTVADFLQLVNERCLLCNEIMRELTVHTALYLPAGLHLYDNITANKSRSLVECGVNDGCELFIWCGKQVDGHYIRTGKECEPLLLSITYPLKDGSSVEMQKPFPKDSNLNELKVSISKVSGIKPSKLILSAMKLCKRSKTKVEEIGAALDGSTLKELGLIDGQRLIVDKKAKQKNTNCPPLCLAKSEAEKCDNQIHIVVENHSTYENQEANSTIDERPWWPVASLNVDKHKTLDELKIQIICLHDFKINPDRSYILRLDDVTHGLGPPLFDHQTVEEVLLDDGQTIIIEPGTPLEDNQIAVRFYCAAVGHSRIEKEIILDKSSVISQCLLMMVQQADLEGSDWHLCKSNWYGEEAEAIENEDATLEEELVKHGDLLVINTGRLPPKGFVRLSLWLLKRHDEQVDLRDGEERGASVISWITSGLQELLGVSHHATTVKLIEEFEPLNEVEISLDDTLLDLKTKIVSILQAKKCGVASPECLRIQEIKGGYPARVLRQHNKTLRFLKVSSSRKLSVQVLDTNEDLSQSAILLNVRKRVTNRRCYGPPQQCIFDAPNGATSSSLHHFISELVDVPVDKLSLAKYFRHKYEWLVISDPPSNQAKNLKNKKSNLRHSPHHIQDGDIIGVKELSDKTDDANDFSTSEDDAARDKLKLVREEKIRRRREERRKGHARRPEVELKIHVDDFTTQ